MQNKQDVSRTVILSLKLVFSGQCYKHARFKLIRQLPTTVTLGLLFRTKDRVEDWRLLCMEQIHKEINAFYVSNLESKL